jgi:hypothetical protein
MTRLNPSELRVIRSYRLTPDTAAIIAELSADSGLSQGCVIDKIVEFYEKSNFFEPLQRGLCK